MLITQVKLWLVTELNASFRINLAAWTDVRTTDKTASFTFKFVAVVAELLQHPKFTSL